MDSPQQAAARRPQAEQPSFFKQIVDFAQVTAPKLAIVMQSEH